MLILGILFKHSSPLAVSLRTKSKVLVRATLVVRWNFSGASPCH